MIITGKKFSKPEMSRVINGDKVLSSAPEKPAARRLDHIIIEMHPEFSRATLQKFIKTGCTTVDGEVIKKPSFPVEDGQTVQITIPDLQKSEGVRPRTIYEDTHVIVLDKPAGLLSMSKGAFNPEPTLEDYGLLVHRLDRDTSGVVILAKDETTQTMLRKQFQDRKTHKTYYAITSGHPKLDEALIDLPIARNLKHPTTFLVQAGGKESKTHYKVIKKTARHALLELKPTTGRTHQLRVHLKYLGTPILGDNVYGTEPAARLYLHAKELEISIPGQTPDSPAERKIFTSDLPPEFTDTLTTDDVDENAPQEV